MLKLIGKKIFTILRSKFVFIEVFAKIPRIPLQILLQTMNAAFHLGLQKAKKFFRELSGLVVECLTRDQGVVDSSLTRVTALCPRAGHIYPCLVQV